MRRICAANNQISASSTLPLNQIIEPLRILLMGPELSKGNWMARHLVDNIAQSAQANSPWIIQDAWKVAEKGTSEEYVVAILATVSQRAMPMRTLAGSSF